MTWPDPGDPAAQARQVRKTLAYTGDTSWTSALADAAAGADLLIAEAYYRDKNIPPSPSPRRPGAHRDHLTAKRIIITHMSADVLDHLHEVSFQPAHDGLVINL